MENYIIGGNVTWHGYEFEHVFQDGSVFRGELTDKGRELLEKGLAGYVPVDCDIITPYVNYAVHVEIKEDEEFEWNSFKNDVLWFLEDMYCDGNGSENGFAEFVKSKLKEILVENQEYLNIGFYEW